jgi:formylglycine-generating enzyme
MVFFQFFILLLITFSNEIYGDCCCSKFSNGYTVDDLFPPGMVGIPGGEFTMGSDNKDSKKDEKPPHHVKVDNFWMDATPVTNRQFKEFVDATGYVTTAEKPPTLEEIMKQVPPGTPPPSPELLVSASLVFKPSNGPIPLYNHRAWRQLETPSRNRKFHRRKGRSSRSTSVLV